jgi:hypothetical protein
MSRQFKIYEVDSNVPIIKKIAIWYIEIIKVIEPVDKDEYEK